MSLARTRAALKRYDTADAEFSLAMTRPGRPGLTYSLLSKIDEAAAMVADAFALDTSDVNTPDQARAAIRLGPGSASEAWLRRLVTEDES